MCDRLLQITSNDFADLGFLDHLLTQAKKLFCLYSFAQKRAFRILLHLNMKRDSPQRHIDVTEGGRHYHFQDKWSFNKQNKKTF